eukprot:1156257-Pelagomonas_calceolata.AAC.11
MLQDGRPTILLIPALQLPQYHLCCAQASPQPALQCYMISNAAVSLAFQVSTLWAMSAAVDTLLTPDSVYSCSASHYFLSKIALINCRIIDTSSTASSCKIHDTQQEPCIGCLQRTPEKVRHGGGVQAHPPEKDWDNITGTKLLAV